MSDNTCMQIKRSNHFIGLVKRLGKVQTWLLGNDKQHLRAATDRVGERGVLHLILSPSTIQLHSSLIEPTFYTTKYSSVVMKESTENSEDPDPSNLSTEATATPARLPWPMKLTSTGKKTPASTPPTLNISEPVLLSSEAVMTGMDHARECAEESRDHSPV